MSNAECCMYVWNNFIPSFAEEYTQYVLKNYI